MVIQSFAAEKETEDTFDGLIDEHRKAFLSAVRLSDGFGSIIDISWGIGTLCMYFVGIVILGVDKVSIGTFVAFSSYMGMFWSPMYLEKEEGKCMVTGKPSKQRVLFARAY